MSSFKRKTTSKQPPLYPGTRISPSSLSTKITSTGIPSLDDILGGGLPLSCSLLVLAPDSHSAYGELVQKYFIAQGLACGQKICIIDDSALTFVNEAMWISGASSQTPVKANEAEDEEDEKASQHDNKIKIAWRYEQMKKFQTTVPSSTPSTEEYCRTFDLTSRIPASIIESSSQSGDLMCLEVDSIESESPTTRILRQLDEILQVEGSDPSKALRVSIPSLGSPQWGNLKPQEILAFLLSLRRSLRRHPHASASISLSPHICNDTWGGEGWVQKLGWLSDAAITLAAFTANPSLAAIFPTHHGLLHIHTLPAPHTILAPSDKFSTLRGISSSAVSTSGSGENNLAFKCMRKRLIFETLHLDLEGGIGERRTTPSTNAIALDAGVTLHDHDQEKVKLDSAVLHVEMEPPADGSGSKNTGADANNKSPGGVKAKKPRKRVAFQSDKPELYDF